MKKVTLALLMLLMVFAATAQNMPANPDLSLLDVSQAKASIAGPDRVYVRSLYYDGTEFSVLLEYDGADGAYVWGPYLAEDKYLQDYFDLDYVYFRKRGMDEVNIYDVYMSGDSSYSGTIKWAGDRFKLERFWASPPPKTFAQQIDEANKQLADYRAQISALTGKDQKEIQTTEDQLKKANQDLAGCRNQVTSLQSQVQAARAGQAAPAAEMLPTRTVLSGFGQGKAILGNWKTSAGSASQSDASQKYAKYEIPLNQNANMLFGFTAKASSTAWVGYGLHFFASGSKAAGGYGFGDSFLVWLTRDPASYQSSKTYLQIYRSFSDIRMVQIASVSIPEAIDSALKVEVFYNKSANKLVAYVNGKKKLEYETDVPLMNGNSLVLRTLGGPVEFSDLTVKAE